MKECVICAEVTDQAGFNGRLVCKEDRCAVWLCVFLREECVEENMRRGGGATGMREGEA